ncbi:MAG: bacterial transcriptional activator domain-containing protein, partial [Deltaproteobacteria bacterium]|nr:bacterial transcriptional activator domain-containing protein [Deltaproteobacteria bacterium]
RRDRLRGRFVRLVVALGSFWEQQQKYGQALECYRHSLEADASSEELCRHLMSCLMTLDRHAEALAVFEQCRRNLLATLGVEPSPATLTLVNTIRAACR